MDVTPTSSPVLSAVLATVLLHVRHACKILLSVKVPVSCKPRNAVDNHADYAPDHIARVA